MVLYKFLILFIAFEVVISSPLLSSKSLKLRNRRELDSFFDDVLTGDEVDKREQAIYNQYGDELSAAKRAVVTKGTGLWPGGVVPYDMSNMKAADQTVIKASMQRMMQDTAKKVGNTYSYCITFRPRQSSDKTYIIFQYGSGCSAHVGYRAGFINKVTLGTGCMNYNVIQHELMHVLGFQHEQNSPNRDNYVKIYPQNIDPNYLSQFQKIGANDVVDLQIPYDVNSIMQYPAYSFTKSGATGPSMEVIDKSKPFPPYVGDRRLSPLDVLGVKRLYKCPS